MRNSICLVGLLAVLVSSSCSVGSVGKRFGSNRGAGSEEIAALRARNVELQRRAVMAEVELERLRKELAAVEAAREGDVESGSGQAREIAVNPRVSTAPAVGASMQAPGEAPSVPRSEIEASDLPVDEAVAPNPVEDGSGSSGDAEQEAVNSNGELTLSAQALYDRGYTLFHRGRYVDSETAFQQFLRGYSATVLGDNAQFWIAEARYARGDVSGALAAYRETATRFPDGNKLPEAQLKIGDCLRDLGDTEAARLSYRQVIREHPSSAAASTARERLDRTP